MKNNHDKNYEPMNLFFQLAVINAKNPRWDRIEEIYGPEMTAELKQYRKAFGTDG